MAGSVEYWSSTTGSDLETMLQLARYPTEVQQSFLNFYRTTICPLLGSPPTIDSSRSPMTRDGTPIEYSFSFTRSSLAASQPAVRFSVDMTRLRPREVRDARDQFLPREPETVVKALVDQETSKVDLTWFHGLRRFFGEGMTSYSPEEIAKILEKAGHSTSQALGFDIGCDPSSKLPVAAKAYFLPCSKATATNQTRWAMCRQAILQLQDLPANLLASLEVLEEYVQSRPVEFQNGARFVATDLIGREKARIKIYLRAEGCSFAEVWELFTLGGRLTYLDDSSADIEALFNAVTTSGLSNGTAPSRSSNREVYRKMPILYFAFSAQDKLPVPKIYVPCALYGMKDGQVARGLDSWFSQQGWRGAIGEKKEGIFSVEKSLQKTL
jgi:DMATS type aromatic prenyltransferase